MEKPQQLNRYQRKNLTVVVEGKRMPVKKYIKECAKQLGSMKDTNGKIVDHEKAIRQAYMKFGLEGITQYYSVYNDKVKQSVKDTKKLRKSLAKQVSDVTKKMNPPKPNKFKLLIKLFIIWISQLFTKKKLAVKLTPAKPKEIVTREGQQSGSKNGLE